MSALTTAPPTRVDADGRTRVSAAVEDAGELWFSVASENADLLSDRADHVAVGLLLPAMRYGRDLHIGGVVTGMLLHRLNREAQSLAQRVHPHYQRIRVTADESAPALARAAGVAAGFSGGIDSFAVLSEYAFPSDVPAELRITHLLSNNVGSHGSGEDARRLWGRRHRDLKPAAEQMGLPFIQTDSNLDEFYPRMGFFETASFRNATVAHLLAGGIGRLHYASGQSFRWVGIPDNGDIGQVDTMALPLLSTTGLTLDSANSDITRVQKTLALLDNPYARYLDVCIDGDPDRVGNCSACWKCVRAMFTLEVAGELDSFVPAPFRLEPYRAALPEFLAGLLADRRPVFREVVEFADAQGWHWNAQTRARASVIRAERAGRAAAGRMKRRIRRGL